MLSGQQRATGEQADVNWGCPSAERQARPFEATGRIAEAGVRQRSPSSGRGRSRDIVVPADYAVTVARGDRASFARQWLRTTGSSDAIDYRPVARFGTPSKSEHQRGPASSPITVGEPVNGDLPFAAGSAEGRALTLAWMRS